MDAAAQLAASLAPMIHDARVRHALASVPREVFVPPALRHRAYENVALPIDCGQTISQPLVVARMLELLELRGTERVLDIGTGSGYHAALLAQLASRVVSVERHRALSRHAAAALAGLEITNVELVVGDGSEGVREHGPFDAINVAAATTAGGVEILAAQLAVGGRLIAPIAADPERPDRQRLIYLRRDDEGISRRRCETVRFVPLVSGAP